MVSWWLEGCGCDRIWSLAFSMEIKQIFKRTLFLGMCMCVCLCVQMGRVESWENFHKGLGTRKNTHSFPRSPYHFNPISCRARVWLSPAFVSASHSPYLTLVSVGKHQLVVWSNPAWEHPVLSLSINKGRDVVSRLMQQTWVWWPDYLNMDDLWSNVQIYRLIKYNGKVVFIFLSA